jgi:hypothetical protein
MRIKSLIMPYRARGSRRTQHHVEIFEKSRPCRVQPLPPRLNVDKIRRRQAHAARLQSSVGEITNQKDAMSAAG